MHRLLAPGLLLAAALMQPSAHALEYVDVLVGYDASAVAWLAANGKGDVESYARSCIEKCNSVLPATELDRLFQFRLAGTVVVNEDASSLGPLAILTERLVDLRGQVVRKTGEWSKVAKARETFAADVVTFLVDLPVTGNVGQGYTMEDIEPARFADWAYSVCSIGSVDTRYTMVHEIGHNMGCGHPFELKGETAGDRLRPYSAGTYFEAAGTPYYTVMGYNSDGYGNRYEPCPAFSSSRHVYGGAPLGDATHDNTRTLAETYAAVAAFRTAKTPPGGDVAGEFAPLKATTLALPIRDAAGTTVGVVQLKYGRMNAKKRTSKVSGTVIDMMGKKHAIKAATVSCDRPVLVGEAKGFGPVSLTLATTSFGGTVNGNEVYAATVGGEKTGIAAFELVDALPAIIDGGTVNARLLPNGERVELKGRKWSCAKAASVKYAKDKETGAYGWVINKGKTDPKKTNMSGLKLTYAPKTGMFKGSFTAYSVKNDKLAKTKFTVNGFLVGDEIGGLAWTKKAAGSYRVRLR